MITALIEQGIVPVLIAIGIGAAVMVIASLLNR